MGIFALKVKGGIIQRQYTNPYVVRRKFYGAINVTFINVFNKFLR